MTFPCLNACDRAPAVLFPGVSCAFEREVRELKAAVRSPEKRREPEAYVGLRSAVVIELRLFGMYETRGE
jgi:hypothetical protein